MNWRNIVARWLVDRKNEPIRMRTVQMILERNNVATILVLLA